MFGILLIALNNVHFMCVYIHIIWGDL